MRFKSIVIFDDVHSILHVLIAFLLAMLSPTIALAVTICYVAYQWIDDDDIKERKGDLIEWMIGLILGALARVV